VSATTVPPTPSRSNPAIVAEAIRAAIVRGDLRGGDRIKEAPLADWIGISRGPVRDALRTLEAEGMVEIQRNRGAFVPEVHAADVLEVYALRANLGSLALQKLLIGRPGNDIGPLDDALAELAEAVAAGREQDAAEADLSFQRAMVGAAAMGRLEGEFERLTWQVRMFIATLGITYSDELDAMLAEVKDLHAAIKSGDAPGAQRLWREKLEHWVGDFIARIPEEDFDAELWLALTAGQK
jgi:DNA-binding GntR family transcriptional regulator